MKYAWIEDGQVRDICPGNPAEHYTPEIAAFYNTQVEDHIQRGATFLVGKWKNPEPVTIDLPPPPVLPKMWTASDIRAAMSLPERVKWDNDASGAIVTAKLEFASAQPAEVSTPVLQMLVDAGDITQETMNKVLA